MFFNRSLSQASFIFSALILASIPVHSQESGARQKPKVAASTAAGGDKPWVILQNQMLTLRTKRLQMMQQMAHLKEKNKASGQNKNVKEDSTVVKKQMDDLVKLYKEYKDVSEEYNKLLITLKYRFPERLAKDSTVDGKPVQVESLENLEAQLDIEGRLSKVYKKAQSQFTPQDRAPAAKSDDEKRAEKGATIRDQDPILLSK